MSLRKMQKIPIVAQTRREILRRFKEGERLDDIRTDLESRGVPKSIIFLSLRYIEWRLHKIAKERGYM